MPESAYLIQAALTEHLLVFEMLTECPRSVDVESKVSNPLGRTLIKDPQTCERAGMVPVALTRIHQDWDLKQIEDEIWEQNQPRWKLIGTEPRSRHLIVDRRLTRRDPTSEDPSARLPSQTIKLWLLPELADKLEGDGRALRFDYQIKEVRHFDDSPGRHSMASSK